MVASWTKAGGAQSRSGETLDSALKRDGFEARKAEKAGKPRKAPPEDIAPNGGLERLNKVLARSGVASRRHVDEMIEAGRVKVNGEVVTELGLRINVRTDRVQVDGHRVNTVTSHGQLKVYFLLNKPAGVLTTAKDDRGRDTVMDLVAGAHDSRIYPVGRLDFDAEGALLLTNDGDLAASLMSPRTHVPKVYRVKVKGEPEEKGLDLLRRGIRLEDGPTKPCEIEVLGTARVNTWVEVTLTEGKNRQLKRMFWRIKHPVMKIQRVSFGGIELGDLDVGKYRSLTKAEVDLLKNAVRRD
jgi:23S rRNA pseudouridine2605 synthase